MSERNRIDRERPYAYASGNLPPPLFRRRACPGLDPGPESRSSIDFGSMGIGTVCLNPSYVTAVPARRTGALYNIPKLQALRKQYPLFPKVVDSNTRRVI